MTWFLCHMLDPNCKKKRRNYSLLLAACLGLHWPIVDLHDISLYIDYVYISDIVHLNKQWSIYSWLPDICTVTDICIILAPVTKRLSNHYCLIHKYFPMQISLFSNEQNIFFKLIINSMSITLLFFGPKFRWHKVTFCITGSWHNGSKRRSSEVEWRHRSRDRSHFRGVSQMKWFF